MHVLIVGKIHSGKSTLINRVISELGCEVSGFETKKEDKLANDTQGSPIYIYPAMHDHKQSEDNLLGYCKNQHVEVIAHAFDQAAYLVTESISKGDIIKMDEIGFMESSSWVFCEEIFRCLDGDKPVIAAVKNKDTPFLNAVRNHPNCRCFYITEENREELYPIVLEFVRNQLEKNK